MRERDQAQSTLPRGSADHGEPVGVEDLLLRVARGDETAFEQLYDQVSGMVFGLARRVLRDQAQSEEVFQEVMLEVWRTASRFDPDRGKATTWILTMTHRRAVDRVRSAQAAANRDERVAQMGVTTPFDEVVEQVTERLEQRKVRRCLSSLTDLQRESVLLAYYQGYSYPEVSSLLGVPLGTVKTRMRDGLIRLRDCLGVTV
ncbi:RNA polymerase sigma-70 factor, ECF subfamily [Lentzea albidocapillata subsp. violacea]|uniref:RNA polymerase sigma-70 factor, ECF subfamily n=1 Tax=Lentzea albidocapillata subsp. violacea TaxID=128104 RepID=A0A1G9F5J3_9PSEU|nr:sigma-70 family RNA polymerase sigma factor [Lentzea albidocapillata]SDK83638.1 RNA polymerase sigma-70 factor, ECF subfamily [Lentzea albidocapillata subsp. violacea]